jgi:DeoR family transcriptional regulator, fructose operon transcriptional repressor
VREVRLRKLQETILRDGSVEVDTIAAELDVSRETIRRDLAALAGQGLVQRTWGGATALGGSLTERDLTERSTEHQAAKAAIARYVANELVADGTSVALDTGTTTVEIARALRGRPITVVTPSLPVINELAGTKTAVLVIGGLLRGRSLGMIGPVADQTARQFHCDLAFISAPAIHPGLGLTDTDLDGVAVKRGLLEQAAEVYAVLDHTKLGRTAFTAVCPLDALTGLVTDDEADPAVLREYTERGLTVLTAPLTAPGTDPAGN